MASSEPTPEEASRDINLARCQHFLKSPEEVKDILIHYQVHLLDRTRHHLGYPYNLHFETADLAPFLQFSINNLGDPFVESNYGVHSRKFEIEVLEFFAALWDIEDDAYWGYTTTCGTEGNLLGVLYGRECHPEGVLYCSRETHYSVPKAAKLYRIPLELIDSQVGGQINYEHLKERLTANKDKPAIVSINAGTTVKGAVDDMHRVMDILAEVGIPREKYYLHCDGALAGLLLPFRDGGYKISFKHGLDSISVSGHKMLGCPMPCGVVITRKEHMERFSSTVEYLNSNDTTIMGSRNGQASLAMWYALQRKNGYEGLAADAEVCYKNAKFLYNLFDSNNIACLLNPYSTTVVFEKPSEEVVKKWQLACTGNIAHVVVMPSVSSEKLQKFFDEYLADHKGNLCVANDIGKYCRCKDCKAQ
eukprot:m.35919 g.35919  ORF g.35919 m.35919 type:complete len:419 (+) comp5751_c0_seq1:310-1566(+)